MRSWIYTLVEAIANGMGVSFSNIGAQMSGAIWNTMLQWMYETVYGAVGDFFSSMGNMGAGIFGLRWVDATVELFVLFGWALFVVGVVVAIFDVAIEYQTGRANLKTTALNILKGFFACSLLGRTPIELYKFCISLQNTFLNDLSRVYAGATYLDISRLSLDVLSNMFAPAGTTQFNLFNVLILIAFAYCVIKIFFQNIKRGGILLIQIAVGSLYMFSVPRGYTDGFVQWVKQVVALCLTAFLQTTLLYLGLLTFNDSMLLGLGVMLAANEVPQIAQQFGLDSSMKVNAMSVMYGASSAMSLSHSISRMAGK